MDGILIFLAFICLMVFVIPFTVKEEKELFLVYIWIFLGFLMYGWGQDFYWTYTHPMKDPGVGAAIGYGMFSLFTMAILIPILIVILWKNLYITVIKGFIIPLIIIFIPIYMLFQGYLLLSAYNAYDSAKQMQAQDINTQDMYDFYTPTIKHIQIQAGNPKRYYRWSYRRGRYVFEINQCNFTEEQSKNKNIIFNYFPYGMYTKDYRISVPKSYVKEGKYNILNRIIIPENRPLSYYFNFNKKPIDVQAKSYNSIGTSIDKQLEKQYGLKKGIGDRYYDNDEREKYGNTYLTYYNETVVIQCHYLENNTTSDTCHMEMIVNNFKYKFDIHKQYIPQWQKIYTGLSKEFESFIVSVKQYPEKLNPYND